MNKPVPFSQEELVATLGEILEGVKTGDTMEGSIEFLVPGPDPCEHCGGSGKMAVINPGSPRMPSCFSECRDNAHQADCVYAEHGPKVDGELDCPMCEGKGHKPPRHGHDYDVRASYRIGNLMGQGGVRIIGEIVSESSPVDRIIRAAAKYVKDDDYCFVCDNHPSHGHADDCPLA